MTAETRGASRVPVSSRETSLEFRLLGPLEVVCDGATVDLGGHRQRSLLAILLVSAGRVLPSDVLIDRLWGLSAPATAAGTLHAYISNLRRILEPHRAPREPARILASVRPGYALNVDADSVDAARFTRLAADGQRALADGDPQTATTVLRSGLDLWRGPALADFADEAFAMVEITRLEEARLQALEDRIEADLRLGLHGALVPELTALVELHPLRERIRGQLMLALYRSSQQSEALDVARAGREYLAEELGLDPDPAIRSLEERILRQDPSLDLLPQDPKRLTTPRVARAGPGEAEAAEPSDLPVSHDLLSDKDVSADGIVDRVGEVGTLDRALISVTRGTGRVVLVGGEPGIGKTHLVESFARRLDGAGVGWGRSHDAAGTPPFWPWRQALRDLTADLEDEVLRATVAGDAAIVADVVPELAPRLRPEVSVEVADAAIARFRFFDAATRLLIEVGRHRPVVVVLDDIHWADAPSLELLRYLATGIRSGRVLVVATYRDVGWEGTIAETLAALARQSHVERLLLSGLSREGVGQMLGEMLGPILGEAPDDELVDAVVARTDGNPLFVTHLANLLASEVGRRPLDVVRDDVPPAIADLIGWRLAVLTEPTRRLLAVGSVVGREFDLGVLVQALRIPADEVLALIEPADRAGLVVETDAPGRFRFTHALIRDAIHEETGVARGAHLHGQIGDALAATRTDDRDVAAIAEHYWRAASVGWADQAIEYALLAADRATVALAHEDEERHLARVLELVTGDVPVADRERRELETQLRRAKLIMRTDGYGVPGVGTAAGRARELAETLGAEGEHLIATWGLIAYNIVRSEHETALDLGLELVAEAETTGNPAVAIAGHTAGVPLVYLGRYAEAIPHLERSNELAATLPAEVLARFPQNVVVGNLVYLGMAHWLLGRTDVAEVIVEENLALAETTGGFDHAFALSGAMQVAAFARNYEAVVKSTERALAICAEIGYRHIAAGASVFHGWAVSHLGDPSGGVEEIERAIGYHDEVGQGKAHVSYNYMFLADALLRAGRRDDALEAVGTSIDALNIWNEVLYAPETWRVKAEILAADPSASREEVADCLRRSVEIATELHCPPFRERAAAQLSALTITSEF